LDQQKQAKALYLINIYVNVKLNIYFQPAVYNLAFIIWDGITSFSGNRLLNPHAM